MKIAYTKLHAQVLAASINCLDIVIQTGAGTLDKDILALVESLQDSGGQNRSEIADYRNVYKKLMTDGVMSIVK